MSDQVRKKRRKKRHRRRNGFKQRMIDNRYYILAFVIPLLTVFIANIAIGVFPFGERAVLIIDSYHQYAPFFSEYYDKILHGGSLFYSWNGGLGINFWAIAAYYLSSPLNLLVLLFPRSLLTEAFSIIITLKIALAGLSFSWYISRHYHKYDISIVYFSLFYALSGWMIGYNWNIMWLDCVVLLPVIILGLERLVKEGRGLLYGISLGLCIFCNYYISIMVCIFLVIYFFVLFIQRRTKSIGMFFKRGFCFAGYSLLGGGLGAVMLLPAMFALLKTHSAETSFPDTVKFYDNFLDIISQHMTFVEPTDLSGLPNLYCGVIALMCFVLYILRRKTPLTYKISRILLVVFLIFSCNVNVLDYIWHGFHYPNSLPNRFTFIYIFIALTMCYEVLLSLHQYGVMEHFAAFVCSMIFVVVSYVFGEETKEIYSYILTFVFLWIYFIAIIYYKYNREKRPMLKYVFALLFMIEAMANGIFGLMMNGSVNRTNYVADLNAAKEVRELIGDNGFDDLYRTEINEFNGRNNAMWLGFKSVSMFSSTLSDGLDELMDHMGFFAAVNKFSYECSTRLTDDILGIKYLMSEDEKASIRGFNYLQKVENNYLYVNQNALSIGFMVDSDYALWDISSNYPWVVLNDYVRKTTGIDDDIFDVEYITGEPQAVNGNITKQSEFDYYFTEVESNDENKVVFNVSLTYDRERYIYYAASHMDKLTVEINGEKRSFSDTRGHIVDLGECGPDDEITLTLVLDSAYSSADITMAMFGLNESVYDQTIEILSENQLVVESYTDTEIKGSIDVDESGIMFTSIPYDGGWTVYVDGEKVETKSLQDSLMYIELDEGHHEIRMKFVPQGFILGLVISGFCLFIFVVLGVQSRKKYKKIDKKRLRRVRKQKYI